MAVNPVSAGYAAEFKAIHGDSAALSQAAPGAGIRAASVEQPLASVR